MTLHALLVLLALFALHFLADFVLQSDYVAQNKSKSYTVLLCHVGLYVGSFSMMAAALGPLFMPPPPFQDWMAFFGITFVAHFLTDAVTSRINARLWPLRACGRRDERQVFYFAATPHNFFVGIGADQLLHQAQLVGTAYGLGLLG